MSYLLDEEPKPKGNKLADEAVEVSQLEKKKRDSPAKPKTKELPFKVKRWLTRNMAGCKHSTGFTADQIYEMLGL
jgi:hypothetical protein